MLLSVLMAFFPKCALCWAAYTSMLGGVALARMPYAPWLFPALIGLSGLHLLALFRKSRVKGYGPFLSSVAGIAVILAGRALFPGQQWVLFLGMILLAAGSLAASFKKDDTSPSSIDPS